MSEAQEPKIPSIGIIGGTGKVGKGLAQRWALNGYKVLVGSRSTEKGQDVAAELNESLGGDYITGMDNSEAAEKANIVVLSVPYQYHRATLEGIKPQLQGKILVDLTVPLKPPKVSQVHLPEGNSAALEAQEFLGDDVQVVAAFQNVSYLKLQKLDMPVNCDILVCGNDQEARDEVIRLVEAAQLRGIDAGLLVNAIAIESLTPVLVYINKRYGVRGAGIRITGIE